jgi:hypothetical protein
MVWLVSTRLTCTADRSPVARAGGMLCSLRAAARAGNRFAFRHVSGNEIDAGLFQAKQEVRIALQTVQLGDDELGAVHAAGLHGLG